ncbi:MAG TPA: hypothetical protein PJ986_14130 [Gammaproteobacteria bacterium]|nr:hypothetical protein [Gammaproteobacteria bacterium]
MLSKGSRLVKVPTYGPAPRVNLTAIPGARETPIVSPSLLSAAGDRLADAGAAASAAGGTALGVAARLQDAENADLIFRAEAALADEYRTFETQASERRGQQAWGLTKDAERWWHDSARCHASTMPNDITRKLFEQSMTKLRVRSLDAMSLHESRERQASLEESAQASITSSINMAAAGWHDAAAVAAAKLDILR